MELKERRSLARAGTIGIEIGAAVIVGLLGGSWADSHFETSPWLTLLGVVLGTVIGLMAVVRAAKETEDNS